MGIGELCDLIPDESLVKLWNPILDSFGKRVGELFEVYCRMEVILIRS